MNDTIRILMLEDSPSDAKLIQWEMKRGSLRFEAKVVDDKNDYINALTDYSPDVILCDHSLPGFNSMDALLIAKEKAKDKPFILVTGSVSEEYAVSSIKAGAQDYILKSNLARLPVAIMAALRQKEAEQRLRHSEEQFQTTIDGMIDGVQIIGYDWRYLYVNDTVVEHGRLSKEDMLGRTMMEKYPGIENTDMFAMLKRCMEERVLLEMENEFTYPSGEKTWFKLSAQPAPDGILVLSRDITDKKMAMLRLEEQNVELRKINDELDRFVYSASHELRAPLCTVLGLNRLARTFRNEEQRQDLFEKIDACVGRLDAIIHDIVHFSRNSRMGLAHDVINFEQLFREAIAPWREVEGALDVTFLCEVQGKHTFYSDKSRLAVVLGHLFSNSVKYRDAKKKKPFIKASAQLSAESALVEITDNGIGIPAEYVDKVFKMFFRGADSQTGSGLGLYIVKEIVDKMGGQVRVESESGQGTSFFITIPNAMAQVQQEG